MKRPTPQNGNSWMNLAEVLHEYPEIPLDELEDRCETGKLVHMTFDDQLWFKESDIRFVQQLWVVSQVDITKINARTKAEWSDAVDNLPS